jgi:hypothetical protein
LAKSTRSSSLFSPLSLSCIHFMKITESMEWDRWEAHSCSACQEIPHLL